MSSFYGFFDPAKALFQRNFTELSKLSSDDMLQLTKSSLTALPGCKLRSVGLTSSLSSSLEPENASNAENALEQLAKCSHLVCQSAHCAWIHVLWDAFKNAWEAERQLEAAFECGNPDEFDLEDRACLTRRDLTSLEGTAEEMGLLEFSWTCNSFLVVDPSKLGNEFTALPEPIGSCCVQTGNKRERAKRRREKAAEETNTPQPAPAMQQARQAGQQHNLGKRVPHRVEHGPAGSQDRSAWRGARRRAVCTSGTTTRHDLCRVRSAAVRPPRVQHGAAALTCAAHGTWTTMTRDFLARWTVEPD
jgi:hypothetical protein